MPTITVTIAIDIPVAVLERKTKLSDQRISELVYDHVEAERKALATEARIATIHLLNGEPIDGS